MFISVDPGQRVGVASFRENGTTISKTTMSMSTFETFLASNIEIAKQTGEPMHYLYENFTLRQDLAIQQTGSDMPAPQVIGMIKLAVRIIGDDLATVEVAESRNLKTALKWAGYPELANKPRSWHCPDDLSAYAHGVMWLINRKIRKHPIFES